MGRGTSLADLFLQVKVGGDLALFTAAEPLAGRTATRSTTSSSTATATGSTSSPRTCGRPTSTSSSDATGLAIEELARGSRSPGGVRAHHRVLGHGPHPAPGGGRRRSGRSSIPCCCEAASVDPGRPLPRARDTATCRATARWASTRSRRPRSSTRLDAEFGIHARRGSPVTTPSTRFGPCCAARSTCSSPWAATSCPPRPTPGRRRGPRRLPAHRPRLDEAEPQPRHVRRDGAHPADARTHRRGPDRRPGPGRDGRGLDEHGAPLPRRRWPRRRPSCAARSTIVCGLARAVLREDSGVDWSELAADYDRIRDRIEAVVAGLRAVQRTRA